MTSPVLAIKSKIMRRFAECKAFDEQTAKSLTELDLENKHSIIMNGMIRRGQIIRTQYGRYYLSPQYFEEHSTRVLWVQGAIIPILLIVIILHLLRVL